MLVRHVPGPVAHQLPAPVGSHASVRRTEGGPEPVFVLHDPFPIRVAGSRGGGRNAELAAFLSGRRVQHAERLALGKNHLGGGRQFGDVVDDEPRIQRTAPETQAVVGVQDRQCVQQRFFALVEGDVPGEKENPSAGKQRLVGHRREYRLRLEPQLAGQSGHAVMRHHIVVRFVVRMPPLVHALRCGFDDRPSCRDADPAGMQHAEDFLFGRRGRGTRRDPHGVGQIICQPQRRPSVVRDVDPFPEESLVPRPLANPIQPG